jgi:DNA-binding PadR family transcriptional regulator
MTLSAENSYDKTPIPLLRGKEGKMNREIILHLVSNGPSTIHSTTVQLQKNSDTTVHYSTINRRMHDLESRNYVEKYGKVGTMSGFETDEYFTTIRGDFAALALKMTPSEQRKMLANAGRRKNSPFLLLEFLVENGLSDLVDRLILPSLERAVKNKYIDLEQPSEGVLGAAFASLLGYRIRFLLNHNWAKEDLKKTLEVMQYLIFNSSIFSEIHDADESSLLPPESDLMGEVIRTSKTEDFQKLFGPNFERQPRSLSSQVAWIDLLYKNLLRIYKAMENTG